MSHILFVDDEPHFLTSVRRVLRQKKQDWNLLFAQTVETALEIARTGPVDTIVSDIKMAGKNGFDLLQALQTAEPTPPVPVIVLTGSLEADLKAKTLEMGAFDLLHKPVNYAELVARINHCLWYKSRYDDLWGQKRFLEKELQETVQTPGLYDPLTRLPNRSFFYEFIHRTIESAARNQKMFALAFIDLDNFSRINKSLGHNIGDECLKIMSHRLSCILRASDCVVRMSVEDADSIIRMGGDYFCVLLQDFCDSARIGRVAKRLLDALGKSCRLDGCEVYLTASIGIAVYPDDGDEVNTLFKNAEAALDHVKKHGKNNFGFYSQFMNTFARETLSLETRLRKAVEQKELVVYYQPKIDLITNAVVGMEALVRWQTSDGGFISPMTFIPLAEENGLIAPIGNFVLETACAQNRLWQNQVGMNQIRVAVNVSGRQFEQKKFVQTVIAILEKTGLNPEFLELEITETAIMMDPETAAENIKAVKEIGITVALDDFGTGYSSLGYLQNLSLDAVKIDISFIKNIGIDPSAAVIVQTIITMAHHLGLKTIAEGVETPQQLEFLKAHGCDQIQGYLFSPPVPADAFAPFLRQPGAGARQVPSG